MSSADKFVLSKGMDNTFTLTIKQTGTTLPMEITVDDIFTLHMFKLGTSTELDVSSVVIDSTSDMTNGKLILTFPQTFVDTLDSEKGSKVDRYYLKPTYRLVFECETTNNGDFIAKVPSVYVE